MNICDKDTAKIKSRDIQPNQILKDINNLEYHELKDEFEIIGKKEAWISCDNTGCLLRDQEFYIYFKFDKGNNTVCILPSEETLATITDFANFALILVVNYIDWMYKNRRLRAQLPQADQRFLTEKNSLYLGLDFSIKAVKQVFLFLLVIVQLK